MKFTVVWTPAAEKQLTELWLSARDQRAVTSAADTIDAMLRIDAHTVGESRGEQSRIVFEAPLAVAFEVDLSNRMAIVRSVWRY